MIMRFLSLPVRSDTEFTNYSRADTPATFLPFSLPCCVPRSPQKVTANTSSVRGCRTEPLSLSAAAAAVTQPSVKCANSTTTAVALSATVPEATIAASALVRCERQQRNSIDKGELATAVCDDEGPTVAFAAAAAVEASQARWPTNRCMDTADIIPQGDPGFSLPFHYPPEATVNNSPSCQLYQGVRGGVVGVGGADDRANRNGGAGAAFAGYSSEVFQTNGSNPAATRMAEAKRNSIEQALYGSCMKRTSFNALVSEDLSPVSLLRFFAPCYCGCHACADVVTATHNLSTCSLIGGIRQHRRKWKIASCHHSVMTC